MDIMLTVSYALHIPREEFYEAGRGIPKEKMMRFLQEQFPKKIEFPQAGVTARREYLMHVPLNENGNALKCASCGKWLYPPGKEGQQVCLEYCKMIKGIPLCLSCAWELEFDLEDEKFVQKLREASNPAEDRENSEGQ